MLTDQVLKALIEGIIYIAPEPVSLDAIAKSLEGEERERVRAKLEELIQDFDRAEHGIQIRQVAGGYKFSSKAEHHEVFRRFVKSLKPPLRLSKPALETLAVVAYRQPVTLPEIDEIRGVDCGGVIHTLLEKKLVVTSGRKNVVGRPILYRTSRDFLVHFGLRDASELPSLREFEEMARQALGPELALTDSAGQSLASMALASEASASAAAPAPEPTTASEAEPASEPPQAELPVDEQVNLAASVAGETAGEAVAGGISKENGSGAEPSAEAESGAASNESTDSGGPEVAKPPTEP
jgi:segregation and condensation protein B